jgi:hypothetical protein
MRRDHPSGRPFVPRKRGVTSQVRFPREGYLNNRLEPRNSIAVIGFRLPEGREDGDEFVDRSPSRR